MSGYGPNRGACPSTCGCPELCDAGESRAEFAAEDAYSYSPQAELDAADREARR